jgi:hypothetical protein
VERSWRKTGAPPNAASVPAVPVAYPSRTRRVPVPYPSRTRRGRQGPPIVLDQPGPAATVIVGEGTQCGASPPGDRTCSAGGSSMHWTAGKPARAPRSTLDGGEASAGRGEGAEPVGPGVPTVSCAVRCRVASNGTAVDFPLSPPRFPRSETG